MDMELSFIFSLALQLKGVDQRAVKDISKLRFTNTGHKDFGSLEF